jgi:hypothetical protein
MFDILLILALRFGLIFLPVGLLLLPRLFSRLKLLSSSRKLFKILAALETAFGLRFPRGVSRTVAVEGGASGAVAGVRVSVKPISIGKTRYLHVVLKSDPFLGFPLEITKRRSVAGVGLDRPTGLSLDPADFDAINRSAGRAVLDEELAEDLRRLSERSDSYIAYHDSLAMDVDLGKTSAQSTIDAVGCAHRIVSRLLAVRREVDLAPHVLNLKIRQATSAVDRLALLRMILDRYAAHPLCRETLRRLAEDPEFDLRYPASRALGADPLAFLTGLIKNPPLADRPKAIRALCDTEIHGGADWLVDLFANTSDASLKEEIIASFRPLGDRKTGDLILRALGDGDPAVKAASVAALAERGGPAALPPLSALAADPRVQPSLRKSAAEAAARIDARHGLGSDGRLSLAGGGGGGGRAVDGGGSKTAYSGRRREIAEGRY